MSSCRNPKLPSLLGNTTLPNRNKTSKVTLGFPRRISDPRFDKLRKTSVSFGSLKSASRFPKLVLSTKGARKPMADGVVTLNNVCERKYRSWSDPTGHYTGNRDAGSNQTETFDNDLSTSRGLFPPLDFIIVSATRDNFEENSFCDSLSSLPCSSLSGSSTSSPVVTDEHEHGTSKHKTVLNWIHSIRRTSGSVNK